MGLQQSKDKLLYQQVIIGNIKGVKKLCTKGAGVEWMDNEGKTPLHHAAKNDLEEMVKLLLSRGANALVMDIDGRTALDLARVSGYKNVVRAIELSSQKVWVVILPCGTSNVTMPLKLELAIYSSLEVAKPHAIFSLWRASMYEYNYTEPDPTVVINDHTTKSRIRLAPVNKNENQQLIHFSSACKGYYQVMQDALPFDVTSYVGPRIEGKRSSSAVGPTAPPLQDMVDDGPVHYSSTDSTPINSSKEKNNNASSSSSCVICLNAPVQGACVPCGHMAGCMSCLNEIKGKKFGCPVCRTKIKQILRLYAV